MSELASVHVCLWHDDALLVECSTRSCRAFILSKSITVSPPCALPLQDSNSRSHWFHRLSLWNAAAVQVQALVTQNCCAASSSLCPTCSVPVVQNLISIDHPRQQSSRDQCNECAQSTAELFGSGVTRRRAEPAAELHAAEAAKPHDPNTMGPPQLSMRAGHKLLRADHAAGMQARLSSHTSHAEQANLANWLSYVSSVIQPLSGGTQQLPSELDKTMQEKTIRPGSATPNPGVRKKPKVVHSAANEGTLGAGGDVFGLSSGEQSSSKGSSKGSHCRSCSLYKWFMECLRQGTHKVNPRDFRGPLLTGGGHTKVCPHKGLATQVLTNKERSGKFQDFTYEHRRVFLNSGQGRAPF